MSKFTVSLLLFVQVETNHPVRSTRGPPVDYLKGSAASGGTESDNSGDSGSNGGVGTWSDSHSHGDDGAVSKPASDGGGSGGGGGSGSDGGGLGGESGGDSQGGDSSGESEDDSVGGGGGENDGGAGSDSGGDSGSDFDGDDDDDSSTDDDTSDDDYSDNEFASKRVGGGVKCGGSGAGASLSKKRKKTTKAFDGLGGENDYVETDMVYDSDNRSVDADKEGQKRRSEGVTACRYSCGPSFSPGRVI